MVEALAPDMVKSGGHRPADIHEIERPERERFLMLPVVVDVTRIVTKIMISDAHPVCSFTALAHGVTFKRVV